MTKTQAKREFEQLIKKFEALSDHERSDYNEANTRKDFILPLFRILGWNVYSKDEVNEEEKASGGRVDYSFSINGLKKFYVEAKAIKVDLDEKQWAEQAIDYAWHKSVPWAILSDFEGLKIFSAGWDVTDPEMCLFRDLHYQDYLAKFDDLWLLSKESFEKGELDKVALETGRRPKRTPIDKQLPADLLAWHDFLRKELIAFNKKLSRDKLEECIQRLLNRLIFIRTIEDRGIENKILQSLVREYERLERKNNYLADGLKKIFAEFNKNYDSKLFEPDIVDSEKFEIVEYALAEVIDNLYKTKAGIRYNFDQIPADILGSIYEQYLGNIQREGEAKDSKSKRKSQGIYYTPRYIVDYIVKNTVGEYIKDKSLHDVQKIKILDPACGSGSFLIRAFEELDNYLEKEKNQTQKDDFKDYLRKIQILSENIYGVDLDDEAVELTRLNLLLKTATRKHPLPDLAGNIKNGNSLISGTEAEMKKIYGKNWEDLKPFDWNEQFKDVFKQGGFDVVIGNPPYLKELDNKRIFEPIKKSEYKKYYQGKMDFWYFFLHRAIDVVKENGIIGFITNSYFLKGAGASKLNDRIKNELVMIKAIDLDDIKVFGDVSGKHIIHIYQKRKAEKNDKTLYVKVNKENFVGFIDESLGKKIPYKDIISDSKVSFEYGDKINFNDCIQLGDIYDVSQGVVEANAQISRKSLLELKDTKFKAGEGVFVLSKKELSGLNLNSDEKNVIKKYLNTSDVGKYSINFHNQYLVYSDKEIKYKIKKGELLHLKEHLDKVKKFITSSNKPYGLHRPREQKYFEEPKLICKGMFLHPEFTLDQDKYYMGFSFSVIIQKDKNYSLRYLLGILNSRLGEYWFNINGKKRGIGVDIGVLVFRKFPVLTATKEQQQMIEKLVDKMIKLNQELQKIDPIMDKEKYEKKKKEIEETDGEIDKLVYKLYNLTSEEIKIVDPAVREQLG